MHLSPAQREEFLYLNDRLTRFAGLDPARVEDAYADPELIERFIRDAGEELTDAQKQAVRNFVGYRKGRFYLVKQYKKYAVLLQQNTLYGVVGVDQAPAEMVDKGLPVYMEAALLPFNDTIVMTSSTVCEDGKNGSVSRSDIEYEFKQIKDVRGITETLDPQTLEEQNSPAAQAAEQELRQYLRTAATRDTHATEIKKILDKYPELHDVYMQMYSKISARTIKKDLKACGVRERHFAVYNNSVVAVAPTRGELLEQLSDLSFDGMMGQCALFRL
ncbi:hypothetical protein [Lewinella sp. IMCC34183]|uniref:hypothetical protein n=1 Tax=Lewinella sp. IMCC34183 TaxID=2248762 RepID=UPI0013002674|nr:hypothetical protein [Lewinella sp. IMCC34183]